MKKNISEAENKSTPKLKRFSTHNERDIEQKPDLSKFNKNLIHPNDWRNIPQCVVDFCIHITDRVQNCERFLKSEKNNNE